MNTTQPEALRLADDFNEIRSLAEKMISLSGAEFRTKESFDRYRELSKKFRKSAHIRKIIQLLAERDALKLDAGRFSAFRTAIVNNDEEFSDRAAMALPDEDTPITEEMVNAAFDAAMKEQSNG